MPDALIRVHVTPRASRNEITGWRQGVICVKITAPPVDGAANEIVLKFLADALGVRKNRLELVAGQKSREKTVRAAGVSESDARAILTSRSSQAARH